jgi:hypothetical protein
MDSNGAVGSGSRKAQNTHTKRREISYFQEMKVFSAELGSLGKSFLEAK